MDSVDVEDNSISENKLEITRNPFDSNLCDKENFPLLDSSLFTMETNTPKRKSEEEFRWSLDQLAKLRPAEMDPFPKQEYSIMHETAEDAEREQKEVDEYFKNVLLPSPWLENRAEILKRVTFSPHPPSTCYIQTKDDSPTHSLSEKSKLESSNTGVTMLSDACCQTMLTFPVNFDLEEFIGKQFYTYIENAGEAKELMISSLRRKLFGHDGTPVGSHSRTMISPSYTTSSPARDRLTVTSYDRQSKTPNTNRCDGNSPSTSPMRSFLSGSTPSVFSPGGDISPIKQASNVGSPERLPLDFSLSPIRLSDEGECEAETAKKHDGYSFLPDVSFSINDSEKSDLLKESERAVKFHSPDVSPIKKDRNAPPTFAQSGTQDSMEMGSMIQSIKESTARNIQTLFDVSSVNENTSSCSKQQQEQHYQKNMDERIDSTFPLNSDNGKSSELDGDAISSNSDSDGDDNGPLNLNDLNMLEEKTTDENMNCEKVLSKDKLSPLDGQQQLIDPNKGLTTPLRGILKNRENATPTRKCLDLVEDTRYNTECNSGRRMPVSIPKFSSYQNIQNVPSEKKENSIFSRSVLSDKTNIPNERIQWTKPSLQYDSALNDELVCLHANSVLRRAKHVNSMFDIDFDEKDSPFNRRKVQLNSTEVASMSSCETVGQSLNEVTSLNNVSTFENSAKASQNNLQQSDSGVGSMEISNVNNQSKTKEIKTPLAIVGAKSVSPMLSFDGLSLYTPFSNKVNGNSNLQGSKIHNKLSYRNRISLYRSHSWPDDENSPFLASSLLVPRSRVTPRATLRSTGRSRLKHLTGKYVRSTNN